MKLFFASFCLLLLFLNKNVRSQESEWKNEFSFMFYNTENFFDCENDSLTDDDEFTSNGDRRWSLGRVHSKAERLAKVLVAAGKWNPPILVGLCEIENRHVLDMLVKTSPLNKYLYKIVHKDSPDERGIDVAILYLPELFVPFDYQAIPVMDDSDALFKTRDILRVSGVLNNCDTIHVFVNHWPSRYGGVMETMRFRRVAAETLKKAIEQLFFKFPLAKIVCMGDFNDSPQDESLLRILNAIKDDNPDLDNELINLSFPWLSKQVQTIKSQYTWEIFDQWIVSDYFLKKNNCYKFSNAEIFDAGFLLEPDIKFGGVKPKRTYIGFKYQEGFSDHLPILLRFQLLNH